MTFSFKICLLLHLLNLATSTRLVVTHFTPSCSIIFAIHSAFDVELHQHFVNHLDLSGCWSLKREVLLKPVPFFRSLALSLFSYSSNYLYPLDLSDGSDGCESTTFGLELLSRLTPVTELNTITKLMSFSCWAMRLVVGQAKRQSTQSLLDRALSVSAA